MRVKGIIAILAIVGLLVFVAVSVLGGNKDKVASTRTALTGAENGAQSQVMDRYSVKIPLGTKGIPREINYQGYLVNSSDSSAVTDTLDMMFNFYDAPTGGSLLWWVIPAPVEVSNGLFNVGLPIRTDNLFKGQAVWLETTIEGETLSPRRKLVSVPYAFVVDQADSNLSFQEDSDGVIGFNYPDSTYDRRLRITAGRQDGVQNTQGACVDLHGNQHSWASGELHLVAGSAGGTIRFFAGNPVDEAMRVTSSGNVGIGTTDPGELLEVYGNTKNIQITNTAETEAGLKFADAQSPDQFASILFNSADANDNRLSFLVSDPPAKMTIMRTGRVGIGTTNPQWLLDVAGFINTTYGVRLNGTLYNHPDYVFEAGYKLMPLKELKKFIKEKRRLPGMSSAEKVKEEGVEIFEQNRLMLEKLEEAYIYIIELEERIAKLEAATESKLSAGQ